jgi:hypothetical protein
MPTDRNVPTFQQWVRRKDAEKRLKKKLIGEAKQEIRDELMEYAKQEKQMHDNRVAQMEDWLIKKKLKEAYSVTMMKDTRKQDDIEREARDQLENQRNGGAKTYKQWMTMKKMQQRLAENERIMADQLNQQ